MKILKGGKRFLKSKVAQRIFFLFVFCALIPFFILAFITYRSVSDQLYDQALKRLHQTGKSQAMYIYERLLIIETEMKTIGAKWRETKTDNIDLLFREAESGSPPRIISLVMVDSKKQKTKIINADCRLPEFKKEEYDHLRSGGSIVYSMAKARERFSIFMFNLIDPRESDGELLTAELNPAYLWGLSSEGSLPLDVEMTVYQEGRGILISSFPGSMSKVNIPEILKKSPSRGKFEIQYQDETFVARYWLLFLKHQFYSKNWVIILSQSKSSILEPISNFKQNFFLLMLLAFLVVLLLSMILIKKSLVPIEILRKSTNKIADGEFDVKVDIKSGDEFEILGKSFNEMGKKLREGQVMLIQAAKLSAFGEMAAGIVHEIGQPLTSILGYTDLLSHDGHSEKHRRYIEIIKKEVRRLEEIILRFKQFTYPSESMVGPVSINKVIDDTHNLLLPQIKIKKVKCMIKKKEDLPLVLGNQNSIQQVFLNLIINSMDAMGNVPDRPGVIAIKTYVNEDKVCVDIKDNGPGIAKDFQKRIFDPFFTTKDKGKGTGLGLAIANSILHKHNAQISLESDIGQGALFKVSFQIYSQGSRPSS